MRQVPLARDRLGFGGGIRLAHHPLKLASQHGGQELRMVQQSLVLEERGTYEQINAARLFRAGDQEGKGLALPIAHRGLNDHGVQRIFLDGFINTLIVGAVLQQEGEGADDGPDSCILARRLAAAHARRFDAGIQEDPEWRARDRVSRSGGLKNILTCMSLMALMACAGRSHEADHRHRQPEAPAGASEPQAHAATIGLYEPS